MNNIAWMNYKFVSSLVSIIIPTYNREHFIIDALDSVAAQSYRPIEILIINDGSTDNTKQLVDKWVSNHGDEMLKVILIEQSNQGAPTARNKGCVASTGEFIQFFDSDDLLHPDKISAQVSALLANPECDFCWSDHIKFSRADCLDFSAKHRQAESNIVDAKVFENVPGTVCFNLYRRHVVIETGPWTPHLKKWQDLEYTTRLICMRDRKAVYHTGVFYFVRLHQTGRIADLYKMTDGIEAGLESLRLMVETIDQTGKWNPRVGKCIAQFYHGLALQSMEWNVSQQVKRAFKGALRTPAPVNFRYLLRLLYLCYHVFGGRFTLNLSRGYTRWAMGRSNRVNKTQA